MSQLTLQEIKDKFEDIHQTRSAKVPNAAMTQRVCTVGAAMAQLSAQRGGFTVKPFSRYAELGFTLRTPDSRKGAWEKITKPDETSYLQISQCTHTGRVTAYMQKPGYSLARLFDAQDIQRIAQAWVEGATTPEPKAETVIKPR